MAIRLVPKSIILFIAARLCEIGGGYVVAAADLDGHGDARRPPGAARDPGSPVHSLSNASWQARQKGTSGCASRRATSMAPLQLRQVP